MTQHVDGVTLDTKLTKILDSHSLFGDERKAARAVAEALAASIQEDASQQIAHWTLAAEQQKNRAETAEKQLAQANQQIEHWQSHYVAAEKQLAEARVEISSLNIRIGNAVVCAQYACAEGMREAARIARDFQVTFHMSQFYVAGEIPIAIERAASALSADLAQGAIKSAANVEQRPVDLACHQSAESVDRSRCSLCGASRIPINRAGTEFGACTFVDCKDPAHDYNRERAAEAQKEVLTEGYISSHSATGATSAEGASAGVAQDRPLVVCLCGSTRFYKEFQIANFQETMKGNIVLSVGFYAHAQGHEWHVAEHGQHVGINDEEKIKLDELHKRKIDLADEVYVLNVGGYIGASTRSEIDYALAHDKPVRYLEPAPPEPVLPLRGE